MYCNIHPRILYHFDKAHHPIHLNLPDWTLYAISWFFSSVLVSSKNVLMKRCVKWSIAGDDTINSTIQRILQYRTLDYRRSFKRFNTKQNLGNAWKSAKANARRTFHHLMNYNTQTQAKQECCFGQRHVNMENGTGSAAQPERCVRQRVETRPPSTMCGFGTPPKILRKVCFKTRVEHPPRDLRSTSGQSAHDTLFAQCLGKCTMDPGFSARLLVA